jgi:hypothetical protein
MAMHILIPNRITLSRYIKVKELMKKMGSPVISCVEIRPGYYLALEGSHRVTAAKELGLEPILEVVDNCSDKGFPPSYLIEAKVRESRGLGIEF